ncbi:MAG: 6-bladed beta-propeller [Candidatus Aminicenantes bacterium]|jgi:hypothetical protein
MKKLIILILAVILGVKVFPIGVKIVNLPNNIKAEENVVKETFVRNLSELEIYDFLSIYVIDENIYITNWTPRELVKLSLQGKLLGRAGRQGQGPGEFLWMETVYEFNGNIALLDSRRFVLMLYTKTLKFIREMRLKKHQMGFMVDNENNFIFFGSRQRDFYFEKYSKDMVPIEYFGPSVSSRSSWKNKKLFDDVRCALYVPEENGIWAAFKDRYDIRYYKNQKLAVEIKAEKGFFEIEEENVGGRIVVWCRKGRALHLAKSGNKLFYFFLNNGVSYCDIFDSKSFRLLRRVAFKHYHISISHYKENIFYSLSNDKSEDDLQLFKLKL